MPSYDAYLEAHRRGRAERQSSLAESAARARTHAEVAAVALSALGVRRVVLFGSLARGTFGERSDIDLAVEGLADGMLIAAEVKANERSPVDVSIVRIEDAPPHIRAAIEREGIELWRR